MFERNDFAQSGDPKLETKRTSMYDLPTVLKDERLYHLNQSQPIVD